MHERLATGRRSDAMGLALLPRVARISAISGVAVGAGMGFYGSRFNDQHKLGLPGTYRLDGNGVSGTYVIQADGTFSQHMVSTVAGKAPRYAGVYGKWWIHNPQRVEGISGSVQHEVTSASDPALVGSQTLRYGLSADKQQLTTSSMGVQDGKQVAIAVSHWHRVSDKRPDCPWFKWSHERTL